MRQRATPLTPEQLATLRTGRDPLDGATVPPPVESPPPEGPADAAAYVTMMNRAVARALSLATTPKELTEALKVATEWYTVQYGETDGGDGLGTALTGGRGNGHGAT